MHGTNYGNTKIPWTNKDEISHRPIVLPMGPHLLNQRLKKLKSTIKIETFLRGFSGKIVLFSSKLSAKLIMNCLISAFLGPVITLA